MTHLRGRDISLTVAQQDTIDSESDSMLEQALQKSIQAAADNLLRGGVVAFPTETVYGLGADATNPEAVRRIFEIKGRPPNHPLIVHIAHASLLDQWAREIPEAARRLAERFWPGPLTLILRRQRHVPDAVTGGQDSVGLRVPNHPLALELLRALGPEHGLAAPSANRFGRISPTRAEHVREELGEAVDMVLDGGPCQVGLESTIVSFVGGKPQLLRPGSIGVAEIEAVLGEPLAGARHDAPRAPGMLPAHYAPNTPVWLLSADKLEIEAHRRLAQGQRIAALTLSVAALPEGCVRQIMPPDPTDYARELYARLRAMDATGCDAILVEAPPQQAAWQAVLDRLERAARAALEQGDSADA